MQMGGCAVHELDGVILKRKELEAAAMSAWASIQKPQTRAIERECWYFDGKAEAYGDIWELITFGGRAPSPEAYNEANERDSEEVCRE
jgi:hypothetical protein